MSDNIYDESNIDFDELKEYLTVFISKEIINQYSVPELINIMGNNEVVEYLFDKVKERIENENK